MVRKERLSMSIAALNTELAAGRTPPYAICDDFIDTTDAECLEERLAQLSPALRKHVEGYAADNILTFDSIIAEIEARGGYTGGWIALRDWTRRQAWAEEARTRMAAIMAKRDDDDAEEAGRRYAEQGRMLGILRVHLMRATSDEERVEITNQIEALEAEFTKTNFG